ncbi:PE family protein [Nocardia alba]|uniref:PE family protein n=1 Tax=Nocardia alba TaxID=225051 RepID=A0A4R1FV71_9NOCA|nr:PE family protein [Nocardia alba]TCJ97754.1 PE family protein [Nocardia alba]
MSRIEIDHELARTAAGRLDQLADGLEGSLRLRTASLSPVAAALDPVSRTTAQTIGTVGDSFQQSYAGGIEQLRQVAANLRAHAVLVESTEDDGSDLFRSLM